MGEQHKGKGDMGEGQHDLLIDTLRTFVMQIVSITIIQILFISLLCCVYSAFC